MIPLLRKYSNVKNIVFQVLYFLMSTKCFLPHRKSGGIFHETKKDDNGPVPIVIFCFSACRSQASLRLLSSRIPAPRSKILPRAVKTRVPGPPVEGSSIPALFVTVSVYVFVVES